ncbi:hypothetical protein [Streptomyces sp. NPDC059072]|uniref:hypothetical protein n=1 Tax=unclassified Streptomyces TaxID=2593676 RepID=UPI00369EA85F
MLESKRLKDRTQVTFVLPEGNPPGPVGFVGDFDRRNAAAHPLEPCGVGTRVGRSLPAHSAYSCRYLAAGDYWFDDGRTGHRDGPENRIRT